MKTLKKMYKDLICNKAEWSYYDCAPELEYDTLYREDASFEFIKRYFSLGGKEAVFKDSYLEKNSEILSQRAPHIVSTYLLGIIIAKSLEIDLNSIDGNRINFKYLWFLACLYHDIGYSYEKKPCCEHLKKLQISGLTAIKEICNIEYFDNSEFKTFTKEYVNIYLSHRAKCKDGKMGVIDHGIAGGLMLYDRLMKNYNQAWEAECKKDKSKKSFTYKGLYFSDKHFKYYSVAADAIISHNIWVKTLNEFLKEENQKIIEKPMINSSNPVAFVLALADTIEPIKIKKDNFSFLDMIRYENIEGGFKLFYSDHNTEHISGLAEWVDINVEKEEDNAFLITKK